MDEILNTIKKHEKFINTEMDEFYSEDNEFEPVDPETYEKVLNTACGLLSISRAMFVEIKQLKIMLGEQSK